MLYVLVLTFNLAGQNFVVEPLVGAFQTEAACKAYVQSKKSHEAYPYMKCLEVPLQ